MHPAQALQAHLNGQHGQRTITALGTLLVVVGLGGCVAGGGDLGSVAPPLGSGGPSLDLPSPEATAWNPSPGASAPAASPGAPAETTTVRAYFMLGSHTGTGGLVPVLRVIPKTQAVGAAAITELLAGPAGSELTADPAMFTDIPTDTRFLGLTIDNGVATVNLSGEFAAGGTSATINQRYGQVVYTLTQFPTVKGVLFQVDGAPSPAVLQTGPIQRAATRNDFVDLLPPIWVDRPAWGGALASPAQISGLANVFEAQFRIQLIMGAAVLADAPVHAACGTGCWGAFNVTLQYAAPIAGWGTLRVFEESAKDGSRINVVDYPVWLTP
jgi:hypothetical protein